EVAELRKYLSTPPGHGHWLDNHKDKTIAEMTDPQLSALAAAGNNMPATRALLGQILAAKHQHPDVPALTAALAAARAQQLADRAKVLDYVNNQSTLLKPPTQL